MWGEIRFAQPKETALMAMFSPGQKNEKLGLTLMSNLLAESWGDIWRAVHEEWGRVLLIAYKEEGGRLLFEESRGYLETWGGIAEIGDTGFLKVHKIYAKSNPPMVVVEDPGGVTLRELNDIEGPGVKRSVEMAAKVAEIVHLARGRGLCPLALTPDTLIQGDSSSNVSWHVIPVALGANRFRPYPGEGRYVPRTPDSRLVRSAQNEDVHALTWLLAESIIGDYSINHDPHALKDSLPYPRLLRLVQNNLEFRSDRFEDPHLVGIALDLWLDRDSAADYRDQQKILKKLKSKKKRDSATVDRVKGNKKAPHLPDRLDAEAEATRFARPLLWGILAGVAALIILAAMIFWFLGGEEPATFAAATPTPHDASPPTVVLSPPPADEAEKTSPGVTVGGYLNGDYFDAQGDIGAIGLPDNLRRAEKLKANANVRDELARSLAELSAELNVATTTGDVTTDEEMAAMLAADYEPGEEAPEYRGVLAFVLALSLVALIPLMLIGVVLWTALNTLLLFVIMNFMIGEMGDGPLSKCLLASGLLTANYFLLSLTMLIHPFIGFVIAGLGWWKISEIVIEGVFELTEGGATVLFIQFVMNVGLILAVVNL